MTFLWIACFCFAALCASGVNSFETPNPDIALSLASTGRISIASDTATGYVVRARDGRFYSIHEPVVDVVAAPAAMGALALERAASIPFKQGFGLFTMLLAAAAFATTAVLLGLVGARLGVPPRPATAFLVILTLGSQYLVYVGTLPDVSLAAPILAACLLAWLKAEQDDWRFGWLYAGVLTGLLAAVKVSMATFSVLLVVLAATSPDAARGMTTRLGRALQVAAGATPGLAVVLVWNYLRTGGWLHAPYPGRNTDVVWHELPLNFAGSLISPAKGLLLFTPLLFLLPLTIRRDGVGGKHPRLVLLLLGSLALSMIAIASTPAWPAGGGWGVRFYVPWLPPLLMLLIAEPRVWSSPWKIAGVAALAAGVVVNAAGLVTNFHYRQQLCGQSPWSWHGANVCAMEALPGNLARTLGAHLPDTVVPAASAANIWASNRLDLWWFSARAAGLPPFVSWLIGAGLLGAGLACWRWSDYRRIRIDS